MSKTIKTNGGVIAAAIIDTETTGFEAPVVPIQFVYMPLMNGEFAKDITPNRQMFGYLFNPGRPIEYGAMAAHGIEPEQLKNEPRWEDFHFNLKPQYLVGHQVDYDINNIRSAMVKGFEAKAICTLALSRLAFPKCDVHKLTAVAYYLRHNGLVPNAYKSRWYDYIKNAHEASADVHMAAGVLMAAAKLLGLTDWESIWEASEIGRIPVIMPLGKHKGMEVRAVPRSYKQWLLDQPDVEAPMVKALTMKDVDWDQHNDRIRKMRGQI